MLYKFDFITFKVPALVNALGLRFSGSIIIFIRKSTLMESGCFFIFETLGEGPYIQGCL